MSNENSNENKIEMSKKSNKFQKIAITVIAVLLLVVGGFSIYKFMGKQAKGKDALEADLIKMGSDFYESFYYDNVTDGKTDEEKTTFLEKFQESGIKINLDNLGRYNDSQNEAVIAGFKNNKTDTICDVNNTRAVILPKAPFGKTDFEVRAELDCGFEEAVTN